MKKHFEKLKNIKEPMKELLLNLTIREDFWRGQKRTQGKDWNLKKNSG